MKILRYKKLSVITAIGIIIISIGLIFNGCMVSQKIEAKSGAQLWKERDKIVAFLKQ